MSESWRDLGGGFVDPNAVPDCDVRCDGVTGMSRDPNPSDRTPVPCPVHRPHLAGRHGRSRARRVPVR